MNEIDGGAHVRAIRGIVAKSCKPIADSLTWAADCFPIGEDQNHGIILVSDGQETCGGDPCALAAAR